MDALCVVIFQLPEVLQAGCEFSNSDILDVIGAQLLLTHQVGLPLLNMKVAVMPMMPIMRCTTNVLGGMMCWRLRYSHRLKEIVTRFEDVNIQASGHALLHPHLGALIQAAIGDQLVVVAVTVHPVVGVLPLLLVDEEITLHVKMIVESVTMIDEIVIVIVIVIVIALEARKIGIWRTYGIVAAMMTVITLSMEMIAKVWCCQAKNDQSTTNRLYSISAPIESPIPAHDELDTAE